ncbi:MAG: hypothetical protein ACYCV7_04565 [Acidimicrobiales bacterium]
MRSSVVGCDSAVPGIAFNPQPAGRIPASDDIHRAVLAANLSSDTAITGPQDVELVDYH